MGLAEQGVVTNTRVADLPLQTAELQGRTRTLWLSGGNAHICVSSYVFPSQGLWCTAYVCICLHAKTMESHRECHE